ncbi:MAG: Gfo/Idh/MocA family protein [Opitutales bacterium]
MRSPIHRRRFLALAAAVPAALRAGAGSVVTVGVVGHTGRGNYGHGLDTVWLKVPGARIVGVSDPDVAGRKAAEARLQAPESFADHLAMLRRTRPQVVAVCPRHIDLHAEVILAAIEAGVKGLYVEKPFVRTLAEADAVVSACKAGGVRLAVAHRNRYHPALETAVKLVAAGEFGAVREVRVRGKQDQRGGGLDLWVLGGHGFNLATRFTGAPVSCRATVLQDGRPAVRADVREGDEGVGSIVGDEIHAAYETRSGIPLFFDSKKGLWDKKEGFGVKVICEKATLDLRVDEEPLIHVVRDGGRTPLTSAGVGLPEPVKDIRSLVAGHLAVATDLLDAMRQGREPLCGAEAGRETIELITGVFASFAAGGAKVELPLRRREHPLA